MAISKFGAFVPAKNFFSNIFDRTNGVAALTPLLYTNQLVDAVNAIGSMAGAVKSYFWTVEDPGGVPTIVTAAGPTCSCDACPPVTATSQGNTCTGCEGTSNSSYTCYKTKNTSTSRVALGIYEIVFETEGDIPFVNAILKVVSLDTSFNASLATVTKVGPLTWTINTYNTSSGALEYNLDKAVIELVLTT